MSSSSSAHQSFGKVHPTLQQYDAYSDDLNSLFNLLKDNCPLANWSVAKDPKNCETNPGDIKSWFPSDDRVAFYTPGFSFGKEDSPQLDTFTYKQLHQHIETYPPWKTTSTLQEGNIKQFVVAILLPNDMMTEMAITLISIMSTSIVIDDEENATEKNITCVAAPLDPNMTPNRIFEVLDQLKCSGLVSTKGLLQAIHFWEDCTQGSGPNFVSDCFDNNIRKSVFERLREVRVVELTRIGSLGDNMCRVIFRKKLSNKGTKIEWIVSKNRYFPSRDKIKELNSPVLLLLTSGTTSIPKVVSLTHRMLLYNALCISSSLNLTRDDIECNAMPLYHIGGIACSLLAVLVSGSSVIMSGQFEPNVFLDLLLTCTKTSKRDTAIPTWYYGVPTMHILILSVAQSRLRQIAETQGRSLSNNLRFIRSGAAHLNHELALQLASTLNTKVITTYSMSECMPVCSFSSVGICDGSDELNGTVGCPIGPSVKVVDSDGNALPQGKDNIGELVLHGPGVLKAYIGISSKDTHTKDGWLKTGDNGTMDVTGRIFLKGRIKEMIKRGGEQISPNQVDDVVEEFSEIKTAVTFGVPNDLWGEEVAVAAVLNKDVYNEDESNKDYTEAIMRRRIIDACRLKLNNNAIPKQIIFVSAQQLLLGPTGKYLRTKMAAHLSIKAADVEVLNALEDNVASLVRTESHQLVCPSQSLNGLRFISACFVVQNHVGLFPNITWLKIQSFSLNMTIFFILGAFQLTCAVSDNTLHNWARFVGMRIGMMHPLFIFSQIFAFPAFLLFHCGDEESTCSFHFWMFTTFLSLITTMTGATVTVKPVNGPAWFQGVFYGFLVIFPLLDKCFRRIRPKKQILLFVLLAFPATYSRIICYYFFDLLNYTILSWMFLLVTSMLMGHIWRRLTMNYAERSTNAVRQPLYTRPEIWGIVADSVTVLLVIIEVVVIISRDCMTVSQDSFLDMRPGEESTDGSSQIDGIWYFEVCDVTYNEFVQHIHSDPDNIAFGRWTSRIGNAIGTLRLGTPIVLLWIFSLSFDRGITARIFRCRILLWLSPLSYPIYLLHSPIGMFYWVATRGPKKEFWFSDVYGYPLPVKWWEYFVIVTLSGLLGGIIDTYVTPILLPYTIKYYMWVAHLCCRWLKIETCCWNTETCCWSIVEREGNDTFTQIENMIKDLTGGSINRSTSLNHLGLDSLSRTVFIGLVHASIPGTTNKLTVQDLAKMDSIGTLVDFLEAYHTTEGFCITSQI